MEWNTLIKKLAEGIDNPELTELKLDLQRQHYQRKIAGSYQLNPEQILTIPSTTRYFISYKVLSSSFISGNQQLIHETCLILLKKNKTLPYQVLHHAIPYLSKHPNAALQLIPLLGELGYELASKIEKNNIINPHLMSATLETDPADTLLTWYSVWHAYYPQEAYQWFKQTVPNLEIKMQQKFALLFLENHHESDAVDILQSTLSNPSELDYIYLLGLKTLNQNDIQIKVIESLSHLLQSNLKLTSTEIKIEGIKKKLNIKKIINIIHPNHLSDIPSEILFNFLLLNDYINEFIHSIALHKQSEIAEKIFQFLLFKNILSEKIKMETLASAMNFHQINRLAEQWITQQRDQIDVEALLQFLISYKIFWTDSLAEKIIALFAFKKINELYDIDVFNTYMILKLNPQSKIIDNIFQQGKIHQIYHSSIADIIRYRKELRMV